MKRLKLRIAKFDDNAERDEYAEKLINWITDEQFGGSGKLEIGKPCLVRDRKDEKWEERYLLAVLPKNKLHPYITCCDIENEIWSFFRYAKPLKDNSPKIDGEIYTWESE